MDLRLSLTHILLAIFLSLGLLTAYQFIPAGKVTVVGEARSEQKTQVATFNAGVMVVSNDKDAAVAEVNSKMDAIITSVKEFGVDANDIKTQNLSIYKQEQPTNGDWRISNDISIKLRDIDKATELADLLTKSGATSVYGPNFTVDDTKQAEKGLVDQAIKNAKEKAEAIAAASGRTLGKVVSVSEGYSSGVGPVYALREGGGGGGVPIEPGTETVSKTVTVTFELQ